MKKERKEPVELPDSVIRLLEFVENHGGPSKVADKLGKEPQIFYNYKNGHSKPGTDFYIAMRQAFSDFDANFILFGERMVIEGDSVDQKELQFLKEKITMQEEKIQLYQAIVRQAGVVVGKFNGVTTQPKIVNLRRITSAKRTTWKVDVNAASESRFGSHRRAV